jgi:hypothetical protein
VCIIVGLEKKDVSVGAETALGSLDMATTGNHKQKEKARGDWNSFSKTPSLLDLGNN